MDVVQNSLNRAERDNDLIYHQDVPAVSALPVIQEASLVQSITPSALTEPKHAIKGGAILFETLVGWGANLAIGWLAVNSFYIIA